jgi:hypothetical protein
MRGARVILYAEPGSMGDRAVSPSRSAKLPAADKACDCYHHVAVTVRRRVRRVSPRRRDAQYHGPVVVDCVSLRRRFDGGCRRREDRCPFRRRQPSQPAQQNASGLVFPDKTIFAVFINNSPMAETFAHLPACTLGRRPLSSFFQYPRCSVCEGSNRKKKAAL